MRRRNAYALPDGAAGRPGRTAPQIALLVRRSADTVQRVRHRYRDAGAAGVPRRPHPGQASRLPATWRAELGRVVEEDPHTVGVDSAVWTTKLLAAHLAAATGQRTGHETVRRQLHAAD